MTAGRRWLLVALAALFGAWALAPAGVPIYDGVGNPDEPYRFVSPPPGWQQTKAPTTGTRDVPVTGGLSAAEFVNTGEQGPQFSLYLPPGTLQAPAGASTVTVTATPTAPKSPLPTDGTIVSNVYHVTATANGAAVPTVSSGKKEPTLQMRSPDQRQPGPVFEYLTSSGWKQSPTTRVLLDVYQAPVPQLGDWALVRLKNAGGSSSGGGINWGLLGSGIALLVVAGFIVLVRIRRAAATES